jgi:hypothetical protein
MKLKRDLTGAIELILSDMMPADIERIVTAVLREAGPVSNTHIGGDAINCAIGTGATLTGRDLIVALEGPIAADPAAQALISRLNKLPSLDTDLPEKVMGRSSTEEAARRAATHLDSVLATRKLADPTSVEFGRTKHSVRMFSVNAMRHPMPINLVGTFFAITSPPLVHHDHQDQFFRWMDCNQRRYAPINEPYFLPACRNRRLPVNARTCPWSGDRQPVSAPVLIPTGRATTGLPHRPRVGGHPGSDLRRQILVDVHVH